MEIQKALANRESTIGFTNDQQRAYDNLITWIKAPFSLNDAKRCLTGAAGTGKTFLVKALIKNCGMSYSTIGLSAPTHKACRILNESIGLSNIKVNTLQSDLGLKLNFDAEKFNIDNPPFDPKGRIKIGDYRLYIVDEASMINRGLCMFLEKKCKEQQTKLLYIGDASQLAPVGEKYSSAFKGVKTDKLIQIVRQGEDNPVSKLLQLLRSDIENKRFSFLEYITKNNEEWNSDYTKGYMLCKGNQFEDKIILNFTDENLTSNIDLCKVIAYTNNRVSHWNKFIRSIVVKDSDKSIITKNDLIISYITIVNDFNDCVIKNSEEYILKDVVNYVDPKYELKGFMVRFIAIHGGAVTTPLFIVDDRDIFTLRKYVQVANHLMNQAKSANSSQRAAKWKEFFEFKEKCLLMTNIMTKDKFYYSRNLDYGFALTAHKAQGSTFDTALVDVNDIVFDKMGNPYSDIEEINRRLYVACSRCKNKLYLKYG